jgi:hypothetical protein
MDLWLNHPRYKPLRDRLIEYLRSGTYRFRVIRPVIFLCGGAKSSPRDTLRDYLLKTYPDYYVFYAEKVWECIAADASQTALRMEANLATLADLVIIIVESPGTFAELGAFALSEPLRAKLLPVVDRAYQGSASFLATGPLRWIDAESRFRPTIYAAQSRILEAVGELDDRISRISDPATTSLRDLASSPKHLLFFLCDLIAVVHPATLEIVQYYLRHIAPALLTADIEIRTLVGLAVTMNLLERHEVLVRGERQTVFRPKGGYAIARPYHHRKYMDLPTQRAAHMSVLLAIPEARAVIDTLSSLS